jgi:hypothetical protein
LLTGNFHAGESQDAYNQVYNDDGGNQSSFGHELIAGGAAFAGFKVFEDHQRKEGMLLRLFRYLHHIR